MEFGVTVNEGGTTWILIAVEVLSAYVWSPIYVAVMELDPMTLNLVLKTACPPVTTADPSAVDPLKKLTVPVDWDAETDAVAVKLDSSPTVVDETDREVVVGVSEDGNVMLATKAVTWVEALLFVWKAPLVTGKSVEPV